MIFSEDVPQWHSIETMQVKGGHVFIKSFNNLPEQIQQNILNALTDLEISPSYLPNKNTTTLVVPHFVYNTKRLQNVAEAVGRIINYEHPSKVLRENKKLLSRVTRNYSTEINFEDINARAKAFATHIRNNLENIYQILLRYESYEVAVDETERALDALENLDENKSYFIREVGAVTAFLPRNQPLYALTCFGIIPSLMATESHVRAPMAMKGFFFDLVETLKISEFFPNVFISKKDRDTFLRERTAYQINSDSGYKIPLTEVVVFTGTMENADKMRNIFDQSVLFIANGAGHNPLVITKSADVNSAAQSAVNVQLYNQGQDCANPNAILVHKSVYDEFLRTLKHHIKEVKIGPYIKRENRVGPISDRKDLKKIQSILVDNAEWIDPETPGVIRSKESIVEPTIICKPLIAGGNYIEQFAPVFFVQIYNDDADLSLYFEDSKYSPNAMYITVFGDSDYINSINKNKKLGSFHTESTIIRNTDLHAKGIERGVKPYGGYGRGASCISIYGEITSMPTLPQRDIYEQLVNPYLEIERDKSKLEKHISFNGDDETKDISEFLSENKDSGRVFEKIAQKNNNVTRADKRVDPLGLISPYTHWSELIAEKILLENPNEQIYTCAAGITPSGVVHFGNLRDVLISYAVSRQLESKGKKVRLIFSWDDFDRFRRVPQGMGATFSQYLGLPVSAVPDPLGEYDSYAKRYESEFERSLEKMGIEPEFRYQSKEYESGRYDHLIFHAMHHRKEIAEILLSFMSSKAMKEKSVSAESFIRNYYPISIFSRFTGKDNTKILEYDGSMSISYLCLDTGEIDTVDLTEDRIAKLAWKVDWPMRWRMENVLFEPAGLDHSTPGGSYDVSSEISKRIFEKEPPLFVGYQFIGIQGLDGKMSSSRGNALSPSSLLEIYEPELLKWLYLKKMPDQSFNLAFDTEIYRQYDEFDRDKDAAEQGLLDKVKSESLSLSGVEVGRVTNSISFRMLVSFGQIVQWDKEKMFELLNRLGAKYDKNSIEARLRLAHHWIENYSSQDAFKLNAEVNSEYVKDMPESSLRNIRVLKKILEENQLTLEELENTLYEIPKKSGDSDDNKKKLQKMFFQDVYNLLISRNEGPRLATFIWAIDRKLVIELLDV